MKRIVEFACLALTCIILIGTVVRASPGAQSKIDASGTKMGNLSYETGEEELRYETGEEELRESFSQVPVGKTAIIKVTKCSNCFFEGFINMGDIVTLKRIDGHSFRVKGLKPGESVITFTDKTNSATKAKIKIKVLAK
jgi:hypothetical protein